MPEDEEPIDDIPPAQAASTAAVAPRMATWTTDEREFERFIGIPCGWLPCCASALPKSDRARLVETLRPFKRRCPGQEFPSDGATVRAVPSLRMPSRRALLALLLATRGRTVLAADAPASAPAPLRFPADFGAHLASRTEWWYLTGALDAGERTWGFQITFFRVPTSLRGAEASRFAAQQLLFAHAALSDLAQA